MDPKRLKVNAGYLTPPRSLLVGFPAAAAASERLPNPRLVLGPYFGRQSVYVGAGQPPLGYVAAAIAEQATFPCVPITGISVSVIAHLTGGARVTEVVVGIAVVNSKECQQQHGEVAERRHARILSGHSGLRSGRRRSCLGRHRGQISRAQVPLMPTGSAGRAMVWRPVATSG